MIESNAVNILEKEIKERLIDSVTYVIKSYPKLNESILIVFFKNSANKIKLFCEGSWMDPIAEITYTQHKGRVFISSYEVLEEYQQKGLGRLLFNLALAHADYNGITSLYGHATPINSVQGINNEEEGAYEKIQEVLYKIYEKLGCKFDFYGDNNTFSQEWKNGDRFNNLPVEFQSLIEEFEKGKSQTCEV